MTTKSTKALSGKDNEETIESLKAKIAELEKLQNKEENEKSFGDEKIQQDEYIPVMSLLPFTLNLSTKERGQGSIKKFSSFGEVKRILYKDLVDIMEASPNFLKAGYYYILDPRVIRFHGLDEDYASILTKEKIEDILSTNSEEGLSLYNSANPEQQKIIISLLVEKIVDNKDSVNLNVVDSIARASGVNITEMVENSKKIKEQFAQNIPQVE